MPIRMPLSIAPLLMASCMAFLPSSPSAAPQAAEPPVAVSFVESVQRDEATPAVTAFGLRKMPPAGNADPSTPTDVVVLFDTSASQTGEFRSRANEALNGLLEKARRNDRFQLTAVDVDCVPLAEGFAAAAADQTRASLLSLDARTPLGSTDMIGVLDSAIELFEPSAAPRSIVYIGDGPGLNGIDVADFQRIIERLRSKRISFSSIGIGPRINWACLAALANATGGMLLVPDATVNARDAGSRLGALAVEPVWWPEDVVLSSDVPDGSLRMLPGRLPPLRGDRDSIVLVEGPLDGGQLEIQLEGSGGANAMLSAAVAIPRSVPRPENSFLEELFRNARDSDGVFLPLLGREGLDLARGAVRGEAALLAALSRQAEAAGAHASAARLAMASLRRDPDNVDASLIHKVAQRNLAVPEAAEVAPAEAGGELESIPAPTPRAAPRPSRPVREPASDSAELAEFNAMRRVRGQQLEQETAVRLRNARQQMAIDPDRSRADLKDLAEQVKRSDDLDPAMRDRLRRQIEISIRESIVRSREKAERDLAAERNRAIGRERARLNDDLRRREDRIKQLTERYNALVEEGIRVGYQRPTTAFTEADRVVGEQIAEEAPDLYANHPVPMTARVVGRTAPLVARILDYDAENVRVRRAQERGFMDALHLVDVAAIPFDDEPPIVYPSAERWREITRLREKYKSVDLANPGSNEKKIYDALEQPVQNFDFAETPLRDVIAQIQDAQGIPVQIDMKAFEDAGLDLETPVTRSVSGITLRSALRLLLGEIDLTYIVKDEVLLITTKEKAAENLVVKVYPVADLVIPVNPSGGLNPFQTGGGLGGAGGINSGQGGGLGGGGGMMGGGAGMGGGMFQVSDARARVGRREKPVQVPPQPRVGTPAVGQAGEDETPADAATTEKRAAPVTADDISLPAEIVDAENLRSAIARYLSIPRAASDSNSASAAGDQGRRDRELAARLARLRATAAALGKEGRFDRAADLISAAIAAGHAESWMFESLAVAMEAAGRPKREVERALLSAADFSDSPAELLALANCLARFGSAKQAIRMCQQVTALDPANREAYAVGMTLAARGGSGNGSGGDDFPALRWACAGVLSQEWPADQQEIPTRAGRLARASIDKLRQQGRTGEAEAFQSAVDEALVRDIELEIAWNGDADLDLVVEEPSGTVCSISSPRSTSGGTLLGDMDAAADPANATHRERYVAALAFPGTYRILVRRAAGNVAANTVTADMTLHGGTDREQKMRRQLPLGADEILLSVDLPEGRRRESLLDAQVAQDVAVQQKLGQTILAQQLAGLADPAAAASLSQSRGTSPGQPGTGLPFFRNGAVGYQPVITTLPEGTNMFAMAVVSADRRYVRVTATPLFSGVGQVTQFNYTGAAARGTGGAGGAGGAGGGAGGAGAVGGVGGICWVAREVYGVHDPRWLLFRHWLRTSAPRWLHDLYAARGEEFARWIHDKPWARSAVRFLMDQVVDRVADQAIESCPASE